MSRRPPRNGKPAPRVKHGESPRRQPPAEAGELIYGHRAGLAVLETRPADIVRVGYDATLERELRDLLRACAARNLPCTPLSEGELSRLAHSDQHEGLLIEARSRRFVPPAALAELLVKKKGLAVAFDRVRNPYNI